MPHLVIRALNCARILVVRALDCAQFILHPALFSTKLEHWSSGDTCLELSTETVVAAAAPSASTQEAVEEATAVDPASNGGAVGGDEPAPPRGADDEDSAASTCDKFISIGREDFDDVLFSSRNKKLRRKKKGTNHNLVLPFLHSPHGDSTQCVELKKAKFRHFIV